MHHGFIIQQTSSFPIQINQITNNMEDTRSISPASSVSGHDEHELDSIEPRSYPTPFNPLWFSFTPLRTASLFTPMPFAPMTPASTPVVRHNFKSIDELLSPLPQTSYTSTPSQRNDDTGYASQILSGSSNSLRQSRLSADSHENEDELENIRPTCASSPIPLVKPKKEDSKSSKTKKIRTAFTDQQKMSLDRFYATNRYPDPTQMENLSRMLGLEEKVIRVWFQNKRSREKSHPRSSLHQYQQESSGSIAPFWQQMNSTSSQFSH